MAAHNGADVTSEMSDIVTDADEALSADTDYLLENIGSQPIFLSRQDSVPDEYPENFNAIPTGGRLGINTGSDSEAFVVWILDERLTVRLSIVES